MAQALELAHHSPLRLHHVVHLGGVVNAEEARVSVLRVEGHGALHERETPGVVTGEH